MGDKRRTQGMDRRGFVKGGLAASLAVTMGREAQAKPKAVATPPPPADKLAWPWNSRTSQAMPMRNLGRTGYRVGVFGLGGQATIEQPGKRDEAIAIINRAIDLGVNYIDTAAGYGGPDQWSQKYIGEVMKTRRREVFLTSKTHARGRDESLRLLEQSLTQLNTDHLDLWQIHNVREMAQIEAIFGPDGAIHALEQAREQKMVRALGITGHADPLVLAAALKRFQFDTILMAVNAADRHYMSFIEHLLPLAVEQQLGIIGMKLGARGRLLSSWTPPPLAEQPDARLRTDRPGTITMRESLFYTLTLPVSVVIIGCDNVAQLEENVRLASEFTPLSEAAMRAIEVRTYPIQKQALFFRKWPQ